MIKEIRIETEQPVNIFLFIVFLLFVGCSVKREPRADFKDKVLDLIVKHANGTPGVNISDRPETIEIV
jgi:hypothetical protein